MADDTVNTLASDESVSEERRRLALEALWEIESIARALCARSDDFEASDLWIRAFAIRLCDLASVGMTALDDHIAGALEAAIHHLKPFERRAEDAEHG